MEPFIRRYSKCIHSENMQITDARFLPISSAYAQKIGLVERIDTLLRCEMEVNSGRIVLAMTLDAFSGRSPLFRLNEIQADKDIELLPGEPIPLSKLSDDTLGRVLDKQLDEDRKEPAKIKTKNLRRSSSLSTHSS